MTTKTWRYEMDIYGDRTDWQMQDHELYNTPLEWPENVFGEELGGGTPPADGDDDTAAAEPPDDELDELDEDEGDDAEDKPAAPEEGAF